MNHRLTTPLEIRDVKITTMNFNESERELSIIWKFTIPVYQQLAHQDGYYTLFNINVTDHEWFLVKNHKNLLILNLQDKFDDLFEYCILPEIRTIDPSFYETVIPLFDKNIKHHIRYSSVFYQWKHEFFIKLEEINILETEFFRNIPTVFDPFSHECKNYEKDFEKLKNQFDRKIYKYERSDFEKIYEKAFQLFGDRFLLRSYELKYSTTYPKVFVTSVAKAFLESSQGFSCQFENPDLYVYLKTLTKELDKIDISFFLNQEKGLYW